MRGGRWDGGRVWVSSLQSWFAYPWWLMLSIFSHLFGHLCLFLEKCLFKSFVHLEICLFVFLLLNCKNFFICSRYKSLIRYMICKYFLPFCGLSFHFPDAVFEGQKIFIWMMSSSFIFLWLLVLPFFFENISKYKWISLLSLMQNKAYYSPLVYFDLSFSLSYILKMTPYRY